MGGQKRKRGRERKKKRKKKKAQEREKKKKKAGKKADVICGTDLTLAQEKWSSTCLKLMVF